MLAGCQLLCSFMESSQPYKYLTVRLLYLCFPDKDPKLIQITPGESQSWKETEQGFPLGSEPGLWSQTKWT